MRQLRESEVRRDPDLLGEAWERPDSFVLLPDKLGGADSWLEGALARLPPAVLGGHFVLLTSGSTGAPKLVVGSRQRAIALSRVLHQAQANETVRETLVLLPLSYSFAFVNQWLWARVHQATLALSAGFADPAALGGELARARSAMLCLVGAQVPLLERYLEGRVFPGIVRVHFAGGRFPQERLAKLAELFPEAEVFNNYGCAEAMPRLTLRRGEAAPEAADIGHPLPGIELRTDDEAALQFRSPFAAVGVVDGQVYRELGGEEWIDTGDLAAVNADGSWRLVGRASEVFKRHGERVSLPALLVTVSSVWAGGAAGYRERDPLGEDGCVLVLAPVPDAEALRRLLGALRRGHPRAHWPLRIEATDMLPLLPNGKPDLVALGATGDRSVLWRQHI